MSTSKSERDNEKLQNSSEDMATLEGWNRGPGFFSVRRVAYNYNIINTICIIIGLAYYHNVIYHIYYVSYAENTLRLSRWSLPTSELFSVSSTLYTGVNIAQRTNYSTGT